MNREPRLGPFESNGAVLLKMVCEIVRCRKCKAIVCECDCDREGHAKVVVWTVCDACNPGVE